MDDDKRWFLNHRKELFLADDEDFPLAQHLRDEEVNIRVVGKEPTTQWNWGKSLRYYRGFHKELREDPIVLQINDRSGIPERWKIEVKAFDLKYNIEIDGWNLDFYHATEEFLQWYDKYKEFVASFWKQQFHKEREEHGDVLLASTLLWKQLSDYWVSLKRYMGGKHLLIRDDWKDYSSNHPLEVEGDAFPHIIEKGHQMILSLEKRAGHSIQLKKRGEGQ